MRLILVGLLLAVVTPQLFALPDDLTPTAYYRLNEGQGEVAVDSGTAKSDAKIVHPLWVSGDWLRFNGMTQVVLGNPKGLAFRNDFTLSARIKLSGTAYGQIVGAQEAGGLAVSADAIKIVSWENDWVVPFMLPEEMWFHLAVTHDKENIGRVYLNGAEVASSGVEPWPHAAKQGWTIGNWANSEAFNGSLSDVAIWNRALSSSEVKLVAESLGLATPIRYPTDEPAPVEDTPDSVKKLANAIGHLAIEPEQLPRYPLHAMMGAERVDEALRIRTHKKRAETAKWLADLIPTFDCPDPIWERCYYYRWLLVRANYQEEGGIPGFYEGKLGGYTRHITYSTPHIMDEVRWLRDAKYSYGQAEILGKRREPDGRRFGGYTHWIPSTLWGTYLVHPNKERLAELLPAWQEDTESAFPGKLDATRPDTDYLLAPPSHWSTGMEWQPAWFYFDNYDRSKETPLWRPDYTAYYYANARAVAEALRELGNNKEAEKFDGLALRIKAAAENIFWDQKSGFFYSVKVGTDGKAWVKEVVGVYPYAFELPDKSKASGLSTILAEDEFWGAWPVTSCSMKCPMFDPKVHLCNWNGPVWPHANSIVANALANGIRYYEAPHVTPEKLYEFLDSFVKLHYEDKGTWKHPNLHEEANADDGTNYGCPDYFHSTYIDLIIRLVGGLVPRNDDTVELYPVVAVPWDHFRLDGVPYHDRTLSIVWDTRPDGNRYENTPKGYTLYVDGKLVGTRTKLEHVTYNGVLKAK